MKNLIDTFWRIFGFFFFKSLPGDKILDRSKFKQIADAILKCILNGQ